MCKLLCILFISIMQISMVSGRKSSSKTEKSQVPMNEANRRYQTCCQKHAPPDCLKACFYNTTLEEARQTFINYGGCGFKGIEPVLKCANGYDKGSDNIDCCRKHKVFKGDKKKVCVRYCQKDPYVGVLSTDHKKCGLQFETILKCHYEGLLP